MFTNKNYEFQNRRWLLFLPRLHEVLQQMPKPLKLSGRKSKTFILEQGVDFFTQQAPKSTANLVTAHLVYVIRSNSSRRICEAEVSNVLMSRFILSKMIVFYSANRSLVMAQYKNIWEEIMYTCVNDMKMIFTSGNSCSVRNCSPMP